MDNNWYTSEIEAVMAALKSSNNGLSEEDAKQRLALYGPNEMEQFKRASSIMRFLRQFHNILIYILLLSGAVTLSLGYFVDTGVIFGVIILNAIFGFIQEGKAESAIEAIREILAPTAEVVRDGEHHVIPAKFLVIGDVVSFKSGDKIPADLRLISAKNLQIQEAILTGESNAVEKNTDKVKEGVPLGDRINMAYGGTVVTYGRGSGVVVATGVNTEIGKIGTLLKNIQPLTTPLIKQMNVFGRWLALATVVLAAATFLVGVLVWHDSIEQVFMSAVSLAVAAIPEGLPPILTIILAIGVTRMARRNAIIRQLPAVEAMGAVSTICTDKTGTLTRNEQTIKNIVTARNYYDVEENNGVNFSIDGAAVAIKEHSDLSLAIDASILCNDADFSKDSHGGLHIHGNSIDKACLELGSKIRTDVQLLQEEFPRSDLIPYESEHKFMATLHHTHDGHGYIYIKGAPEQILQKCSHERIGGDSRSINKDYWNKQIEAFAGRGYRVLAIACKEATAEKQTLLFKDVTDDLVLVAIFGFIDAPRVEAAEAIAECYEAGIKVKMITGDHAMTAATIASQVGIDSKSGVLTGAEIDKMTDDDLVKVVGAVNVYARTSPHHKLRLVQALQTNHELVAMTGDGVNDAPALRKADIGVAMGQKGAEIAKESAAMVLADDNFASIVHAIEEGRTVYDNLKKVIMFLLPTNTAEAFVVVMAIVFGFLMPITPVQILWVNMVTAVTLGIALGFEAAENDIMRRPPRKARSSILSPFLIWRVIFVSILFVVCVFGLFMWELSLGADIKVARTVAVNMLVLCEAVYLLNCRKIYNPVLSFKELLGSKPVLISIAIALFLQVLFTYAPIMQHFFGTSAMSFSQWLYVLLSALILFLLVEFEKLIMRRFTKAN